MAVTGRLKILVAIAVLLAIQDGVFGAKRIDVRKRMAAMMDHFNTAAGKRSLNGAQATADQALGLKTGENLQQSTQMKTVSGSTKIKYKETYKGIPVAGEGVVLETDTNGQWTGDASGQLVEGIQDDLPSVKPALSKSDAFKIALENAGLEADDVEFDESTDAILEVSVKDSAGNKEKVETNLAYKLNFRTETAEGKARPFYIIDAFTGEVLLQWEGITNFPIIENFSGKKFNTRDTESASESASASSSSSYGSRSQVYVTGDGGNVGRGRHIYGEDYDKLLVTKIGRRCCLTNDKVEVMEFSMCNYTRNRQETNTTHCYSCYEGNHDFANGAYSPSNDAFFYSYACYNMYKKWYNTEPLKFKIRTRVHYANYANAFWDGKQVIFLDGGYRFFPLTEPSIVGHEISHGFTEHNSGLIYASQSGGMNEAFSDMAGETLEYYLDNKTDFLIGGNIAKHNGRPFRYMEDPTKDGRSLATYDDYCDGIDVHYSSGIFNRAFYLLVNDKKWPIREAFHVFVVANQIHWRETSGFHDAACGVKIAAKDLGYKEEDVFDAFRKVGVIPCLGGPTTEVGGIGSLEVKGKGALFYVWQALPNVKNAKISLAGGSGDANMLVQYGSRPKVGQGSGSSGNKGGDQVVTFPRPKEGNYYIAIYTDTGFKDARVDVSYSYSDAMTEITKSMLLHTETKVYYYGGKNHTWVKRIFTLKSIPLKEFLSIETKSSKGRVYIEVFSGEYAGKVNYRYGVGWGVNRIRVCKVKAKQYYIQVWEEMKEKEKEKASECELCATKDSEHKFTPLYAFSGTKLKVDNGAGC